MASYPSKYENLLTEAGLLGEGLIELRGYVSSSKNLLLDEQSQTWKEGFSSVVDTTEMPIFINPSSNGNVIRGDWTVGLTKEQIKAINEECGVPLFTNPEEWPKTFNHGYTFDLSIPADMAIYRIALHNEHIAKDIKTFDGSHQAYWYNIKDELEYKIGNRRIKAEASSYSAILSLTEKKDMLSVLFFNEGFNSPYHSDQEAELSFMDYCETHAEKMVKIKNQPDLKYRVILVKAIDAGGLVAEGQGGQISYANGKVIAQSFEECVKAISTDRKFLAQLVEMSEAQRSMFVNGSTTSELDHIAATATVRTVFNTTITSLEDVKLWGAGACRQYLAEHNVTESELMSIEDMQKEILKIHESKLVNA